MEFLNYLRDEHSPFESQLVQAVSAAVQEVRNDEKKGVEYMTIQQKLLDEKNLSFQEGEAAGLQKGLITACTGGFCCRPRGSKRREEGSGIYDNPTKTS